MKSIVSIQKLSFFLVSLMFLFSGFESSAQVSVLKDFNTPILGMTVNALPGQTFYRVHVYENTGIDAFNGDVVLQHSNTSGGATPLGTRMQLNAIKAVIGDLNPYVTPGIYNPFDDPTNTGGALTGTNMQIVTQPLSPDNTQDGSFFLNTSPNNYTFSLNANPLGGSKFFFIIEEIQVMDCITNATLGLSLDVDFTSNTQNMCNGNICDNTPNDGAISLTTPNATNLAIGLTGNTEQTYTLADNPNCEGKIVNRELSISLSGESLKDFEFRLQLNKYRTETHQIFEAIPSSFEMDLLLDTDLDGNHDVTITGITLEDLLTDAGTVHDNNFTINYYGDALGSSTAIQDAPNAPYDSPAVHPASWNINHSKTQNFVTFKRSLTAAPVTTAPTNIPDDAAYETGWTISQLHVNLAQLYIEKGNDIFNSIDNYAANAADYGFPNAILSNKVLSIGATSMIKIRYQGKYVLESEADPSYAATFEEEVPYIHQEALYTWGYGLCEGAFVRNWPNHQPVDIRSASRPYLEMTDKTGAFMMMGSQSSNFNDWDGDVKEITIGMPNGSGGDPFRKSWIPADPLIIWETNNLGQSSSRITNADIEFLVELEKGLSIPCPHNPSNAISGLSNSSGNPSTCTSANFGNGNGITYSCGQFNTGQAPGVEPGDVFYFLLKDGNTIKPTAMHIEPITSGACEDGQRWIVRFPLSIFFGTELTANQPPSNEQTKWLLSGADLKLNVQGYCPAVEPKVGLQVKAYVIPREIDPNNPPPATLALSAEDDYFTPNPNGNQNEFPYFRDYSSYLLQNDCDDNRYLAGNLRIEGFVNCPGCKTPGVLVYPQDPYRHEDFIGWEDANNDGLADLNAGNPIQADLNKIDRQLARHGDVVTLEALCLYYPGDAPQAGDDDQTCTDGDEDHMRAIDLYNGGLVLDKWVFETTITPPNFPSNSPKDLMYPLIKGATDPDNYSTYNTTQLFEQDDDFDFQEYDALAQAYPSIIEISDGTTTINYEIQESDLIWLDDGQTLRIVLDMADINAALVGTNYTYFDDITAWSFVYKIQWIIDVDKRPYIGNNPNNLFPLMNNAAWTDEKNSFQALVSFRNFSYVTDNRISKLDLLTETNGNTLELINHPPELEEAIGDLNCNVTQEPQSATWWCEAGGGNLRLTNNYTRNRMLNQKTFYVSAEFGYMENNQLPADAKLAPCTQVGPIIDYLTGARGNDSPNDFKFEIRPGQLMDEIVFHVPEPFLPEGIRLYNSTKHDGDLTAAQPNNETQTYFIPLQGPEAIASTPIPQQNGTITTYPYGITIESGVVMDDAFFPHYQSTSPVQPLGGSAAQGDPLFAIPAPAAKVRHYKITIPIHNVFNGLGNQNVKAYQLNPVDFINNTLGVPFSVGDEHEYIKAAIYYSVAEGDPNDPTNPVSQAPLADAPIPTTAATGHETSAWRKEHNSYYYYTGNPKDIFELYRFPSSAAIGNIAPVYPNNSITQSDLIDGTRLHPSYENTHLVLPTVMKRKDAVFAASNGGFSSTIPVVTPATNYSFETDQVQLTDPAVRDDLKDRFDGVVPPIWNINTAALFPKNGYLFFDQRSAFNIEPVTNNSILDNNNSFTVNFEINTNMINELNSMVAPIEVASDDPSVINMLDPSMAYSSYPAGYHYKGDAGGAPSEYGQFFNILKGLYFYLEPNSQGNNASPADLIEHFSLKQVKVTRNTIDGLFQNELNTYNVPVPMALNLNSTSESRLFKLPQLAVDSPKKVNTGNRTSYEVELTIQFDCADQDILNTLTAATDNDFPFKIHLNYNCNRDKSTWSPDMANTWINGNQNYLNSSYSDELDWKTAQEERCSNNRILEGNAYTLDAPTIAYAISGVSAGSTCNDVQVSLQNTGSGSVSINTINITYTSNTGQIIQFTEDYNCGDQVLGAGGTWTSQDINLAGVCLSEGTLDVQVTAIPYCIECPNTTPYQGLTIPADLDSPINLTTNPLVSMNVAITQPTCTTAGSAIVTVDGVGNCPISYCYSAGNTQCSTFTNVQGNSFTLNQLSAPSYNLRVQYNNGCEIMETINIIQNVDTEAPVFNNVPENVLVDCIDNVPDMVSLTWTDNIDGTGTVTGVDGPLTGGPCGGTITRTWTYTDACGNTATATQTITVDDITAPTGTAPADASYQCISDVPTMSVNEITNVADNCTATPTVAIVSDTQSGTCPITITRVWSIKDDCNNETLVTQLITISPIVASATTTASCNEESTGKISVSLSGGCAPYTYCVQPTNNTTTCIPSQVVNGNFTISNLAANTYNVTIVDQNGCTVNLTNIIVNSHPALNINTTVTNACPGQHNGTVSLSLSGGTPPYYFSTNGNGGPFNLLQSNPLNLTGLSPGSYTYHFTDASECISSETVIVKESQPISFDVAVTDVSCNGGNDGAIGLTISGGTSPYQYCIQQSASTPNCTPNLVSNANGNVNITGLAANDYDILVEDINGCTGTLSNITVNEPLPPTLDSLTIQDADNCQCNGSINWSSSQSISNLNIALASDPQTILPSNTNLCQGEYILTFTDVNGCPGSTTATVGNSSYINPTYYQTIDHNTALPAPGGSSAGSPLVVTGSLYVPLGQSLVIPAQYIVIEAGATVLVEGNLTLQGTTIEFIDENHELRIADKGVFLGTNYGKKRTVLTSGECGKTWAGVRNENEFYFTNKSLLEHARIGVKGMDATTVIDAQKSRFYDNYVGIEIIQDGALNLTLNRNIFDVDNNGAGLNPHPFPGLNQDRANQHLRLISSGGGNCSITNNQFYMAQRAIELTSCSNITIGGRNIFEDNDISVFLSRSQKINVNENRFVSSNELGEVGIQLVNASNITQALGNTFISQTPNFTSDYTGVLVLGGSVYNFNENVMSSLPASNDRGIFLSQGVIRAASNTIDGFDWSVVAVQQSDVEFDDNTFLSFEEGLNLTDLSKASILNNDFSVGGTSVYNTPRTAIRMEGAVVNATAVVEDNSIENVDFGIHLLNLADAFVQSNSLTNNQNTAIWLFNPGLSEVTENFIVCNDSSTVYGILVEDALKLNAPYIAYNDIERVLNGIFIDESWHRSIYQNTVLGQAMEAPWVGNGIHLSQSVYTSGNNTNLLGDGVELNTVTNCKNGIVLENTEFKFMRYNEMNTNTNGLRLTQLNPYAVTPIIESNNMIHNKTGWFGSGPQIMMQQQGPPTALSYQTVEIKAECNAFVNSTKAMKFAGGLWKFTDLQSNLTVYNTFDNTQNNSNNYKKVLLQPGSSVRYNYLSQVYPLSGLTYDIIPQVQGPNFNGRVTPQGVIGQRDPCAPKSKQQETGAMATTASDELELLLYPNPTRDKVFITYQLEEAKTASLTVTNVLGKTMHVIALKDSSGRIELDVQDYPAGVYSLTLYSSDGSKTVKLIVTK